MDCLFKAPNVALHPLARHVGIVLQRLCHVADSITTAANNPPSCLTGVTGHSRSLRNCQGFGSAQITLEPLKGPPIETRIERLVDGKTALAASP